LFLSAGLLGKRDNAVSDTALRIVASMKRDWMQASIFFVQSFYLKSLWKVVIVCPVADWEEAKWIMWCSIIYRCTFAWV
jgi:hypothetical protein